MRGSEGGVRVMCNAVLDVLLNRWLARSVHPSVYTLLIGLGPSVSVDLIREMIHYGPQ